MTILVSFNILDLHFLYYANYVILKEFCYSLLPVPLVV